MTEGRGGEKVVAFVPVRLTSSRLPRKHLRMIGDRTLLSWVVDRVRAVPEIEQIVVCAPDDPISSIPLRDFCDQESVHLFLFPGNVNDVVGRLNAAARHYAADICVMASGDCPLIASDVLANMVRALLARPQAGWVVLVHPDGRPPIHEGMLVARLAIWQRADELSTLPEQREHQFPVLWQQPELFAGWEIAECTDAAGYRAPKLRISVDTGSDLEFMQCVYRDLKQRSVPFDLTHVLEHVRQQPRLAEINRHVHQRTVAERPLSVLFVVSAVAHYGYGNLPRGFEITDELVERWGASARFFVHDEEAQRLCDARGFASLRGDFGDAVDEAIGTEVDLVIFDVDSGIALESDLFARLKQDDIRIVVIDNFFESAKQADLVIVPAVHHAGPLWPNVRTGLKYVVMPKAVIRLRDFHHPKQNLAVVYPGHVSFDTAGRVAARLVEENPGLTLEFVTKIRTGLAEALAVARFVVSPLSQTLYEGVFLGAAPVVLSDPSSEREELLFLDACAQISTIAGDGARQIGELVVTVVRDRGLSLAV